MSDMDLQPGDGRAWGGELPGAELRPEIKRQVLSKGRAIVLSNAQELSGGSDGWYQELTALGLKVLVERARSYEPSHGVRFSTYVYPYIRGAMIDALRQEQRETSVRRSIALSVRRFGATNEEEFDALFDPDDKTVSELETYAQRMAAATFAAVTAEVVRSQTEEGRIERGSHAAAVRAVRTAVGKMSEVDQRIYELYYCAEPKRSLEEVGKELGVSVITARRYHQAFQDRLRALLSERGIDEMPWMP
jgi:RNA polymerase sigma factor (sigma-70 family)